MDPLYFAYYLSLFVTPLIFYVLIFRKQKTSTYSQPSWYYVFKKLFARPSVKALQEESKHGLRHMTEMDQELPMNKSTEYESDSNVIYAADTNGNYLSIVLHFKHTLHMDISVEFRSKCGKIYKLPNEPLLETYSTDSRQWKAGGLNVEVLNPLRRLRITYNGVMRCFSNNNDATDLEYVRFSFFWNAGSEPFYHPQDVDVGLLTDCLAREPWRDGEWLHMLGTDSGFEQYGVLQGHFSATSFDDDVLLYMPSWRRRRWGPTDSLAMNRDFHVFGVTKDGTVFCVGARSFRLGATQLRYGTVLMSSGVAKSISSSDISLEDLADNMEVPNIFTLHFRVDGKTFKCVSHVNTNKVSMTVSDEQKGWLAKTTNVECDINLDQARGIVRFWYKQKGRGISLPPPLLVPQKAVGAEDIFVVSLTSPECLDLALTGGKGNSLGLLSSMTTPEFTVPPGFVITSNSFRRHLEDNPKLVECVQRLQDICCGTTEGNPESICKETMELFAKTPIKQSLSAYIKEEISALGNSSEDWTWAVRSSAIGEDSDELSSAGQNSTFLGCKTPDDVLKAIAACWGSLFAFQSVEYRRQHGLTIQCDMAVVVQKMVPAESAGVLFTSHPATGDPSQMVITSNYGLGESVVSASADPDCITLAKSLKGNVKILDSVVGTKKTQITLGIAQSDDEIGSTEEKEVDADLAKQLSVTAQQVLRLGKLGILLENAFGNPRDIEWAFYNDHLYVLQSRPITTLNTWTDWEFQHEFDTPVMSKNNLYTRANVGEVLKGALTPLTQSLGMQSLDMVMQAAAGNENPTDYYRKCLPITSHFVFMDVINFMCSHVKETISMENTVTDLAIFGHKVLDKNMLKTIIRRHGTMGAKETLQLYAEQLGKIVNNKASLKLASQLNNIWRIKITDYDTPQAIMDKIDFNQQTMEIALNYHTNTTRTSIIYQMIAMIVLAERHKDFNTDHYHDISLLLAANANVESAEIPVIVETIASEIRSKKLAEEFVNLKPEDGMNWLGEKLPESKQILDIFLKAHGHRGFRELELFEKTWDMQPEMVVSMLQSNCVAETVTKKTRGLSVEDTISKLISPSSNITRRILKFIVKKCRVAVAARETTKSVVIKTCHKFRIAFKELGKRMVKHSYIPHEDLVFFFTIEELRSHLKERNPVLVSKAVRRRKLYDKWNSLHFLELSYGVPVPEQEKADKIEFTRTESGVKINGTPVCKGNVVGRACVITDIKDIDKVKPGDILITHSTDIAWSPYFPILSGVITEIGGLISHGAVVAREYGLPCVVGAQNATKCFQTGDKVLLDGKTGVIELVL